jgi:DNA primase
VSDEVDVVRSRTDIVELVGERVSLKKAGKNYKGLCPFHEDRNPSFVVSPHYGTYRCWSCGETGSVFDWVMKTQSVDFAEALRLLAKRAGVELRALAPKDRSLAETREKAMEAALAFFRKELIRSSEAKAYCERRGLDAETLMAWEIGYAPEMGSALAESLRREGLPLAECRELFLVDRDASGGFFDRFRGRLMFPIRDERGGLVAFGGRLLGDGQPKYINSGDTPLFSKSRVLYGLQRARMAVSEARTAVLVEGYLDVIACHRAGLTNAIATLGTSLAEEHAKLLKRWCDRVIVLYDADAAGEKAAERACSILAGAGIKVTVALLPDGEDPDTLLRIAGPEAVRKAADSAQSAVDFRLAALGRRLSSETSEYWTEAAAIVAEVPDRNERLQEAERLAARYPFSSHRETARRAVLSLVREAAKKGKPDATPTAVAATDRFQMSLAEADVFRALAEPTAARVAWEACRRSELFGNLEARKLAAAVAAAFPDAPPEGSPSEWLGRLEGQPAETMRKLLVQRPNYERPVTAGDVQAVVVRMEARLAERDRADLARLATQDDASLAALQERLKAAHSQQK